MATGLWVVLNVDNVDKSVEWYKSLGLKVKGEKMDMPGVGSATMGTLDVGGSGVIFWDKHIVPPDQPADTKAWVSGDLGKGVMLSVGVSDARKIWANAQKLRAEVDSPIEDQPFGGRSFTLVDPDGYVLGISDKWPGEPVESPKRPAELVRGKKAKKSKGAKARGVTKRSTARKATTKKRR